MKDFWNERYRQSDFVYGEKPNNYFKEKLKKLSVGKILLACEGEGRNAVYASELGWDVFAFDSSEEGKKKAEGLASKKEVEIDYRVSDVQEINYEKESFDALALIYAHFPKEERRKYHQHLASFLKRNGVLMIEGFSRNHAEFQKENPQSGGPKNIEMLYDLAELMSDFEGFEFTEAMETKIELNEGLFHVGKAAVVRILAVKKE